MPLLLDIFKDKTAALKGLVDQKKSYEQLTQSQQKLVKQINEELKKFIDKLALRIDTNDTNEITQLLTLIISSDEYSEEYNALEKTINTLYQSNLFNSSLNRLYVAFKNKENIGKDSKLSLVNQQKAAQEKLNNLELKKSNLKKQLKERKKIDDQLQVIEEMRMNETHDILKLFQNIPADLLEILNTNPIPKFSDIDPDHQEHIRNLGVQLSNILQKMATHFTSYDFNVEFIMPLLAEATKSPEFDTTKQIVKKLCDEGWLGYESRDACSLINTYAGFCYQDSINKGKDLDLSSLKKNIEIELKKEGVYGKSNAEIYEYINDNKEAQHYKKTISRTNKILHEANLMKPEYKTILKFEDKLIKKIASIEKQERNKKFSDSNFDRYKTNKKSKKGVLKDLLKQIQLYKEYNLSLDDLMIKISEFNVKAKGFEHTSSVKTFFNESFCINIFTVDSAKIVNDLHKELNKNRLKK
ncbi:MAG: hypothetical protein P4M12_10370 [Gammaproteobacteria bacterium]|nr:hypothetical protein [Gammaproteobacteria bacterium]